MNWKTLAVALASAIWVIFSGANAHAAGTLKDATNGLYAEIVDHSVRVVLNNGFARTEVTQVFANPAATPIDAIYEFPIPKDAALSEMTIELADRVMHGKVLPREEAEQIYADKKKSGSQAGLATKDGHQNFRFSIANIPPSSQAMMTFVYYEPLKIDEAVGRYLYPLQDGGTSDPLWNGQQQVSGLFRFDLELKSTLPIEEVSMPGLQPTVTELGIGHYQVSLSVSPAELSKDLVFLYRFPNDLERRLELVRHRSTAGSQGTFMAILTPGIDLKPITTGTDYVFVLDVSGSMESKIASLIAAVNEALSKLGPGDRFRIFAFNDSVTDVSGGWQLASASSVAAAKAKVSMLTTGGSTDVFLALSAGVNGLNADRVASLFLITDAETNTGIVNAAAFEKLVRENDVRIYGLLMSNNANWPLMQVITEGSGGFYGEVSNQDDIQLQVQQAFDKATHEALHDVKLDIVGTSLTQTTDFRLSKVYKGQQLILFGRYDQPGNIDFTLHAKASGQPQVITKSAYLPEVDPDNPEIVKLWALDMVHAIERQHLLGLMATIEAKSKIVELGVNHQLVTDYTAMVVIDDQSYADLGLEPPDSPPSGSPPSGSGSGSGWGSGPGYGGGSGYDYDDEDDYAGALDVSHWALFGLLALGLAGLAASDRFRRGAAWRR